MSITTPSRVPYTPGPEPVLEESKAVHLQRELRRIADAVRGLNEALAAVVDAANTDITTKANLAGGNAFTGNQTISGTLGVTGAVDFDSTLNVDGTLNVEGATTIDDTLTVTGAATLSSTIAVTGDATFDAGLRVLNAVAPGGAQDLSEHIDLFNGTYGWSITSGRLNNNVPSGARHSFYSGTTLIAEFYESFADFSLPISCGNYYIGALNDGTANDAFISCSAGWNLRSGIAPGSDAHYLFRGNDSTVVARIDADGAGTVDGNTIMTREKGDARFAAISSLRFKPDAVEIDPVDLSCLTLKKWTWGGELDPSHPRFGGQGSGFIAEEVAEVLPSAVTYDPDGNIQGLDALSLLAHHITNQRREIADLKARLAALESA